MHERSPCQVDEPELELIPAEVSYRSCGDAAELASRFSVARLGCAGGDADVVHGAFLVTFIEVGDVPAVEVSKGVLNG